MNSFYGGKQGRTYHIVARYDEIYIDENAVKPDGSPLYPSFVAGTTYHTGDCFKYNTQIFKVLAQKDGEGKWVEDIVIQESDISDKSKVAIIRGMVNEFKKGGAYTEANYGEYVIIDTILNQNHRNESINGLLYRRGFDYTEEPAIADKPQEDDIQERNITAIPEGETEPQTITAQVKVFHDYGLIKIANEYQPLDKGFNNGKWTAAWRKYVTKPGGGAIYVGQIVGPKGSSPQLIGIKWEDLANLTTEGLSPSIVPASGTKGWDAEKGFNDVIQLGYCDIKEPDGDITGCYISFNIPQQVTVVTAQSVDAYGQETRSHYDAATDTTDEDIRINAIYEDGKWKYSNLIHQNNESKKHPFYSSFDIAVPQGIRGTDLDSIQVEDLTAEEGFKGQYFTYYTKDYLKSPNGIVSERRNQWPYRVIENIDANLKNRTYFFQSIDNQNWKEGRNVPFGALVPISISENEGKFLICIISGTTGSYENMYPRVTPNIQIGTEVQSDTSIWRVVNIPVKASVDELVINYTQGNNNTIEIRTIDYLSMADNGDLYITYTDSDEQYFISNIAGIKNIEEIEEDDTNKIKITYTNGGSVTFKYKQVKGIRFTNDYIAGPKATQQKFQVQYKGSNDWNNISQPINSILALDKVGDIVLAFYSDPQFRRSFAESHQKNVQWFERPYTYYDKEEQQQKTSNEVWIALGDVEGFVHVYGDFESLAKLEEDFPHGFAEAYTDRAGWVATVREGSGYSLYAYNYNSATTPGWYKIKDMADNMIEPTLSVRVSTETEESPQSPYYQQDNLNINGVWFVITEGHHS